MDQTLFNKVKQAAIDSIKNPGKNKAELPKETSEIYPEIYLFRHGETMDNKNHLFSGWRDTDITKRGHSQALLLANKLRVKDIDVCITSPLKRTKKTAQIALKYNKNVIFEEDERIIERNYGDLTGHSKSKMMAEQPELAIKYRRGYDFPPPRGESLKMVEDRVFPFCEELIKRIKQHNINVAISAHGNSMRAIRRYFEKMDIVTELTHENPLGTDYCSYVVKVKKLKKNKGFFTKKQLEKLHVEKKNVFGAYRN